MAQYHVVDVPVLTATVISVTKYYRYSLIVVSLLLFLKEVMDHFFQNLNWWYPLRSIIKALYWHHNIIMNRDLSAMQLWGPEPTTPPQPPQYRLINRTVSIPQNITHFRYLDFQYHKYIYCIQSSNQLCSYGMQM